MPDVVTLLNAPAPWDAHDSPTGMPASQAVLLDRWPGTPADFGKTSGSVAETLAERGPTPPETPPEPKSLAPGDLTDLQSAIAAAEAPAHLRLTGPIRWTDTLVLDSHADLTLDFSAARIEVSLPGAPLIRIHHGRRIALAGLFIGQRHATTLEISNSQDISLASSALSGAEEAAISLTGRCDRVLIDHCAFLANDGPAIRARGEVCGLIVARSSFAGPAPRGYIALAPLAGTPRGLPGPEAGEPGRDALMTGHPTDIRLLENRFSPCDASAIAARGTLGLWVERNDFDGVRRSVLVVEGPATGLMLSDSRLTCDAAATEPPVRLEGTALACLFRNIVELTTQPAFSVTGATGGLLVAANTLMPREPETAPAAAIEIDPRPGFLATTLMLNAIRGPFRSGVLFKGALPRLFLFDNHLFGMSKWSFESAAPQPFVTSMNNWSPMPRIHVIPDQEEAKPGAGDAADDTDQGAPEPARPARSPAETVVETVAGPSGVPTANSRAPTAVGARMRGDRPDSG